MKVVFYGNLPQAYLVRDLLRENGIAAEVANELLAGVRGEVPWDLSTSPAVWIADESRAEEAKSIIEATQQEHDTGSFTCASCGESVPLSFTACWNCGKER